MLFSEHFKLTLTGNEDWFDPVLSVDTELYVDPFLIFDREHGEFSGAHDELIALFNHAFKLVAKTNGKETSPFWTQAVDILLFPEAEEVCLGVSALDTAGRGSGRFIARTITSAIWKAIRKGRDGLGHFEEVQLFERNIGPDRISDATVCILRHRFAKYTQRIAEELNVPCRAFPFPRVRFDPKKERWISGELKLPYNPFNNSPIMLVPKHFLRGEPSINGKDFWDYCYDTHYDVLRRQFGADITRNVDKETILDLAKKHPEYQREYVASKERGGSDPYDLVADPKTKYKWYSTARDWCVQNPLGISVANTADLNRFLDMVFTAFGNFIENQQGWKLLWNDNGSSKSEDASQVAFLGLALAYCRANNVDISREANIGRGPVDFKIAGGYSVRCLIEVKLARNTRFWHGLEKQLPKYLKAEGVDDGIFLVVRYHDEEDKKIKEIKNRVAALSKKVPFRIRHVVIDARFAPPSASTLL